MIATSDVLIEKSIGGDAVPGPSGTDVLSDVLRVFRVTGAALLRAEFNAPWGCDNPPASAVARFLHPGATRLIIFHIIAQGSCWVEVDGQERRVLQEGDIVGFPHGHAHRMGNGAAELVPIASLFPPPPWMQLPVLTHGGSGDLARVVCIYLRCDPLLFDPFLTSLPTVGHQTRRRAGGAVVRCQCAPSRQRSRKWPARYLLRDGTHCRTAVHRDPAALHGGVA